MPWNGPDGRRVVAGAALVYDARPLSYDLPPFHMFFVCIGSQDMLCGDLAARSIPERMQFFVGWETVRDTCHAAAMKLDDSLSPKDAACYLGSALAFHFALAPDETLSPQPASCRPTHCNETGYPAGRKHPLSAYSAWLKTHRPRSHTVANEILLLSLAEEPPQWRPRDEPSTPENQPERNHNPKAYSGKLYEQHHARLVGFARIRHPTVVDSEELAQNTFVMFYTTHLHATATRRFAAIPSVESYLRTMLSNSVSPIVRRDKLWRKAIWRIAVEIDVFDSVDDAREIEKSDLVLQARWMVKNYLKLYGKLPPALLGFAFPTKQERERLLQNLPQKQRVYAAEIYFSFHADRGAPYSQVDLATRYAVQESTVSEALARAQHQLLPRVRHELGATS